MNPDRSASAIGLRAADAAIPADRARPDVRRAARAAGVLAPPPTAVN